MTSRPSTEGLFEVDDADPADVVINVHRAMANNARLLDAWTEWASTLYGEVGDGRTRELAILAVARAVESRYVWHQHVPIALDDGISRSEILAISNWDLTDFTSDQTTLLEYVREFATGEADDATHDTLARYFDDRKVVTIAFLANEYVGIAAVIDALAVELDGEFISWKL